ncbi:MAG: TetR family transcriptional regulator [Bacteroidetes bacterium RIFCSPLOWO2_12_FULL_35_15]|nr:MAG: TetR family transcriptional regulator [Bacteroidetes bacterium RIFCSPLOWO2_12_FULL_35_15]
MKVKKEIIDPSTEEKIKNAARKVFTQKGYAGTKTRDIAEEAGINLALLNYYFRSKEKLFDIIMLESFQEFMRSMISVFNDEKTSLEKKIESMVSNYIDLLIKQPDIPLFILSELRNNPNEIVKKMSLDNNLMKSFFMKQIQQAIKEEKISDISPVHFFMNMMSLTVFPFVASPMLKNLGDLQQKDFDKLMQERKKLIPKWIKATMKVK